jgi:ABC-type nitrate/sulfonate/bicarbonate transport system substrate-binding protein
MTLIPFKIGKTTPANTFLAIWVARAAGFYEEQGLDLEIVDMIGGTETGPALSSGKVHLMHIVPTSPPLDRLATLFAVQCFYPPV